VENTQSVTPKVNILLVDDLDENLRALEALLRLDSVEVVKARSGSEALQKLLEEEFALALVDVQMPEMSGFELAELMRNFERTRHVPIIFVTAADRSTQRTFQGYESGAVDFLYKPLDPHIVKSKVRVFVELERKKRLVEYQISELFQTKLELQKALEVRNEFMSIASHELKTPITSLKLQLQMMIRQATVNPNIPVLSQKIIRSLGVCTNQVRKLVSLVEDLLDVSKIEAGKLFFRFEVVELSPLIDEVIERFHEQLESVSCPIEVRIESQIRGQWDRDRLEQVIINLLSNVVKYAPGKPVLIEARKDRDYVEIGVKDLGPGIPQEKQQVIFERFERAIDSAHISGLGMGLFIAKQIVQGHEGKIWVESDGEHGSRFLVRLPLKVAS
jgi:signal transduction histidine kinase